jgi:DNA-nicking Smr family endonuclease
MAKRRRVDSTPAEVPADELELFAREVETDRRLARDENERVRMAPRGTPPKPSSESPDLSPEDLDSHVAPGVDRRELRKLRRGNYAPDMRIDLHGLMAAEAVTRVKRVLDAGPGRRPRCLCVVHGRGLHSVDNVAVLKSRVRALLGAHPAVLAFTDAPRSDGGGGAAYVLLRRASL